jgi:hypothetical protein
VAVRPWPPRRRAAARMRSSLALGPSAAEMKGSCRQEGKGAGAGAQDSAPGSIEVDYSSTCTHPRGQRSWRGEVIRICGNQSRKSRTQGDRGSKCHCNLHAGMYVKLCCVARELSTGSRASAP